MRGFWLPRGRTLLTAGTCSSSTPAISRCSSATVTAANSCARPTGTQMHDSLASVCARHSAMPRPRRCRLVSHPERGAPEPGMLGTAGWKARTKDGGEPINAHGRWTYVGSESVAAKAAATQAASSTTPRSEARVVAVEAVSTRDTPASNISVASRRCRPVRASSHTWTTFAHAGAIRRPGELSFTRRQGCESRAESRPCDLQGKC